jgi:hypothetical protein
MDITSQRIALIFCLTLAGAASAHADSSYSCDDGVIMLGVSTYEVQEKCGDPQRIELVSGGGADVVEENWYYSGATKLPYLFRMSGGKLIAIERLQR